MERSRVRGPTSALSSFLRERGIRVPTRTRSTTGNVDTGILDIGILDTDGTTLDATAATATGALDTTATGALETTAAGGEGTDTKGTTAEVALVQTVENTGEVEASASASASNNNNNGPVTTGGKRKRSFPKKNEDNDPEPSSKRSAYSRRNKPIDDISDSINFCLNCSRRYKSTNDNGQCDACQAIGIHSKKTSKRALKKAQGVVFEVTGTLDGLVLPLRDLCLRVLSDYIEDVEQLGYISPESKQTFARLISKRRQLTNETISLFLGPDEDKVCLYDCTMLDQDGLSLIPLQCHALRVLDLGLVGQMTDHVLDLLGENCTGLESLSFKGAYLCNPPAFTTLFSKLEKLDTLKLSLAAKLSNENIQALSESCTNLRELVLDHCPKVSNQGLIHLQTLKHLDHLTINSVGSFDSPTLSRILSSVGSNLKLLSLNQHEELGIQSLSDISTFCTFLTHLSIQKCPLLTESNEKLIDMFSILGPLQHLSLSGNVMINNDVIICIVNTQVGLEVLNVNGLDELSFTSLEMICRNLPRLEEIDLSWIRSLDDSLLAVLLKSAGDLKVVKVFGCHQLSQDILDLDWVNGNGQRIVILGNEFD